MLVILFWKNLIDKFLNDVNETALRFTSTYLSNKCGASKHSFLKGWSSGENVCGMKKN